MNYSRSYLNHAGKSLGLTLPESWWLATRKAIPESAGKKVLLALLILGLFLWSMAG